MGRVGYRLVSPRIDHVTNLYVPMRTAAVVTQCLLEKLLTSYAVERSIA